MRTIDCSACGRPLHCGVDTASCWCARVDLDPAAREQLAAVYADCLCPDCLAAAGMPHPDAEASWAAQARWLRLLAASPRAQVRELGDGFAVLTGSDSNADNGVVCSAGVDAAAIAEVIGWFQAAGAPAQWLVDAASELGPRLEAAGGRAERTGVVMGAATADLPAAAQPPEGVEIVDADLPRWLAVAEATGLVEDPPRAAAALDGLPGVTRLLALRGGEPVGIASALAVGETLFLQHLAVLETERRRGIGRSLTAARLRAAPGCRRAVLDPTPDSTPFHRGLGFGLRPALRDRVYYLPPQLDEGPGRSENPLLRITPTG